MELSDRKKQILESIIRSHIETMQPVGSRLLSKHSRINLSAATIRNEMSDLEDMGYIMHPHTSAGRVPTDKGYRYYVDNLLKPEMISQEQVKKVKHLFRERIRSVEEFIAKTSQIISTISRQACIAVLVRPEHYVFKQVNLVQLSAQRVLVIWVTTAGLVFNEIIEFEDEISEDFLNKITRFLNHELVGVGLDSIAERIEQKLSGQRDSLHWMNEKIKHVIKSSLVNNKKRSVLLDGRNYLLEKPEFKDIEKAQRLFAVLENENELMDMLEEDDDQPKIRIHIGRENKSSILWDCSLISIQYELPNMYSGMLSILGPRRLAYNRAISLLDYMTRMVNSNSEYF